MCPHVTLLFLLSIAAAAAPSDTSSAHLGAANRLLNLERFEQAAIEYQQALEINPKLLSARRNLAECRFELREYDPARTLLTDLLRYPSTKAMSHYYLGRIDLMEGQAASAIAQFLSIPRAHPFRDERYFLGMAYYKSGAWENSETALEQSLRENPRDFRSHQLLARVLQKLGRASAAAKEFSETRRLLNYYTEGSQALKRCGQVLANKNADEAERVCGPLLTTDDVDKLTTVGMLLGKAGSFEQAKDAWKRAASLDPQSSEIRYDLALTCFHLNDRICARDNAKAAIQARTDFPEANVLYATVLYTMGADAEALPALRRARALNPQDRSIRELLIDELLLWAKQYARNEKAGDARNLLNELDGLEPLQAEQEQRFFETRKLLESGDRQK